MFLKNTSLDNNKNGLSDADSSKKVLKNIGRKDKDLSSFVSQKLAQNVLGQTDPKIENTILNYDILSLPNSAQSVFVSKDIADIETAKVGFAFSLIMKGNALKRTRESIV